MYEVSGPLSMRSTRPQETASGFPGLSLNSGAGYRPAVLGRATLARFGCGSDEGGLNMRRRCSNPFRSTVQRGTFGERVVFPTASAIDTEGLDCLL